jgi:hypothetical protein
MDDTDFYQKAIVLFKERLKEQSQDIYGKLICLYYLGAINMSLVFLKDSLDYFK